LSVNRYLPAALNIAKALPLILVKQGLNPLISRYVLTETARGDAWLFVVMDDSILEYLDYYSSPRVLSDLTLALQGHQVFFGNCYGVRYAILLSPS
jgi:hypothetical protein